MLTNERSRPFWFLVVAGALVSASWLAHASAPRINRARVEAAVARGGTGALPVLVDEALVAALDEAVATPEARARLKQSVARMQSYRAMLNEVLAARGLSTELAAVALMESGFDNDVHPGPDRSRGAGLWQLIPTTARANGLRVDATSDERLDPRRATEAAAALLANLHQRFGDWSVAITAYGRGAVAMDKVIAEAGTREGRALQQRGLLGRYLTRVQVGVLVLRDPSLLD